MLLVFIYIGWMANSADPKHVSDFIWSESALFSQLCLSKYVGGRVYMEIVP